MTPKFHVIRYSGKMCIERGEMGEGCWFGGGGGVGVGGEDKDSNTLLQTL